MVEAAEVWQIVIVGGASLTVLVTLIVNIEKIKSYIDRFNNWRYERMAKKLHPYIQNDCTAMKGVQLNTELLDKISKQLDINTMATMRTLGNNINTRCFYHQSQGFINSGDREQLLAEYVSYFQCKGNGNVLNSVDATLQLPYILGGPRTVVDMSALIERYLNSHNLHECV